MLLNFDMHLIVKSAPSQFKQTIARLFLTSLARCLNDSVELKCESFNIIKWTHVGFEPLCHSANVTC